MSVYMLSKAMGRSNNLAGLLSNPFWDHGVKGKADSILSVAKASSGQGHEWLDLRYRQSSNLRISQALPSQLPPATGLGILSIHSVLAAPDWTARPHDTQERLTGAQLSPELLEGASVGLVVK